MRKIFRTHFKCSKGYFIASEACAWVEKLPREAPAAIFEPAIIVHNRAAGDTYN